MDSNKKNNVINESQNDIRGSNPIQNFSKGTEKLLKQLRFCFGQLRK